MSCPPLTKVRRAIVSTIWRSRSGIPSAKATSRATLTRFTSGLPQGTTTHTTEGKEPLALPAKNARPTGTCDAPDSMRTAQRAALFVVAENGSRTVLQTLPGQSAVASVELDTKPVPAEAPSHHANSADAKEW